MDDGIAATDRSARVALVSRRQVLTALGIGVAAVPLATLPGGPPGPSATAAAAEAPAVPPYDALVGLI